MSIFSKITKAVKKNVDHVVDKVMDAAGQFTENIGKGLNNATGVTAQMDKSYEQQKEAMNIQNDYNKYMWDLQNEYNSPASQFARMKEAGIDINPTSYALGTGNLSNTAALVGSASGFSGSGSPAGNPISSLMGVVSGIQGVRESKARTENMYKQNQNLDGVIQSTRLENAIRRHNLTIARDTDTPVNSMPSLESAIVREGGGILRDVLGLWSKHRQQYIKEHPDYNGW